MLTIRTTHGFDNPFRLMDDMRRQLDWFFGDAPFAGLVPDRTSAGRLYAERTEDGLKVQADLPGVRPEDVNVVTESGVVRVTGERKANDPEGYRVLRRERNFGRFERAFALPDDVDPERAEAEMKDGVLTLRFPLRPENKPRSVAIKVA